MRFLRLVFGALVVAALSLASAPAQAQDDRIGLSRDGVSFTDTLTEPLFDPDVRWVPGDVRTATFFVRNRAQSQGSLDLSILRAQRDDLLETTFLDISARAGLSAFTTVSKGGAARLLDGELIDSGDTIPVRVQVALRGEAPNGTQVLGTDLELKVNMRDARVVADMIPDDLNDMNDPNNTNGSNNPTDRQNPADISGLLPDTGSSVQPWLVPLALVLIVTGAVLMARRRDDEDEEPA